MLKLLSTAMFTIGLVLSISLGSISLASQTEGFSGSAQKDILDFKCVDTEGKSLEFTLDRRASEIIFKVKSALGEAQLILNQALKATVALNKISFDYPWYYTASYVLEINGKNVSRLVNGDQASLKLTGNDQDQSSFDKKPFKCKMRHNYNQDY